MKYKDNTMNHKGTTFYLIAAGGLLTACTGSQQAEKQATKPNIIYILADDLGYGDLGCYGQDSIKTPDIDKMASEGMRFTDHYAGSTVCAPSRSCLMTGQHTGNTIIRGNKTVPLRPDDITVAELLKKAGYVTGLMGKWGLGEAGSTGIPNKQGFDCFVGYLNQIHAHNSYPAYLWKNQDTMHLNNKVEIIPEGYAKGIGGIAVEKNTHSHDVFTNEAFDFVKANKDTSFFLYLAYTLPHANNEAWYWEAIGMEAPDTTLYQNKSWPAAQKAHAAMISYLDKDVGRLLNLLRELKLDKNTLVIFTSDNGPHKEGGADPVFFDSNGPLTGLKRDLYEGGIRIPMIAWWPGEIKPGQVSSHISAFWDFMPTACEIAGVKPPNNIDGISFLPELLGEDQPEHDYLYWEFFERNGRRAVRKGQWKAVQYGINQNPDTTIQLFDLSKDIEEKNDVASDNPEIVKEMKSIFKNARTPSEHFHFDFE